MANPNPPTAHLKRTAGPGRPKGSKNKITRERWEREVRRLAFSNIIDAFTAAHGNKKTFTLRELRQMPEDFQRCISSVKVRTENLTAGDDAQDTTVEIKLWEKTKALELGARAYGWLKEKVEHSFTEENISKLRRCQARAKGE